MDHFAVSGVARRVDCAADQLWTDGSTDWLMREVGLDGIRIVDLTSVLSRPWATMILADQGVDVIKLEQPGLPMFRKLSAGIRAAVQQQASRLYLVKTIRAKC